MTLPRAIKAGRASRLASSVRSLLQRRLHFSGDFLHTIATYLFAILQTTSKSIMSSTDAEPRPFSSRARGDSKRRRSSKKNRNKPHRYPTRRELEGKNHAKLEKELQEVRAAEERTQRRYEVLKRAGTLDGEDGADRTSDLEIATAASCADQQSQQGSHTPTNEFCWPGCARLVKIYYMLQLLP